MYLVQTVQMWFKELCILDAQGLFFGEGGDEVFVMHKLEVMYTKFEYGMQKL